ncbi:phosphoribosylglycinamide formyltransferase [bacterium]|nr:phosphoribosylglycinamide formyltransferase [bacterium]
MKLAFLASGRGSNFEALVNACQQGRVDAQPAMLIVDQPQAGALQVAQRLNIPAHVLPATDKATHERAIAALLQKEDIDLLLLAGYMRLLSPFLVGLMYDSRLGQSRILNIHPADTRRYQGLHGYRWALQNQLTQTAVTVHYVDEGMDTGPIIAQESLPILPNDDIDSLQRRGLALEHDLYPRALQSVIKELQSLCAVS